MEGTKKIKSTLFHQYSWNSEVETMWISLIGWHHKTFNTYLLERIKLIWTYHQTRKFWISPQKLLKRPIKHLHCFRIFSHGKVPNQKTTGRFSSGVAFNCSIKVVDTDLVFTLRSGNGFVDNIYLLENLSLRKTSVIKRIYRHTS